MAALVELVSADQIHPETGEERVRRAVYKTVEEALLQAAHDLLVGGDKPLRVDVDGEKAKGAAEFKKALAAYRKARSEGLSMNDDGSVTVDTSSHVAAMKGI